MSMERLWSPWRSQYISSIKTTGDDACVFCDALVAGDDKGRYIVHRGTTAFIIMNLYPYNNGHLLIIPNRHVAQLDVLSAEERLELMDLSAMGIALLRDCMGPHGFNLGANMGRSAGAGIEDHIHLHIVPRWNGDTNFMPVLADTKMISEGMDATYARLMDARARLIG